MIARRRGREITLYPFPERNPQVTLVEKIFC
jgi:hypothetical protein